jgi:hypothetical protein
MHKNGMMGRGRALLACDGFVDPARQEARTRKSPSWKKSRWENVFTNSVMSPYPGQRWVKGEFHADTADTFSFHWCVLSTELFGGNARCWRVWACARVRMHAYRCVRTVVGCSVDHLHPFHSGPSVVPTTPGAR